MAVIVRGDALGCIDGGQSHVFDLGQG